MPGPIIGTQGFNNPPEEIRAILGDNAYQYFVMIHTLLFTRGILDEANINGSLTDTIDHSLFANVQPYQHHGSDDHAALTQASTVAAASTTTVTVDSTDAGGAYTAAEQTLINELKTDLNQTAANITTLQNKINQVITVMKSAGLMA